MICVQTLFKLKIKLQKQKKVVPLAGRKHKLPEKEPEETSNPALAVDTDPTRIQVEVAQDLTMKRRNPESIPKKTSTTAPIKFPQKKKAAPMPISTAVDADPTFIQVEVSEDINLKKRTPMGSSPKRPPPPALNIPPEVTNIDTTDDDNLKVPSPRSDPPQSTRSDISEYDSVGEMFAAELQDEVPLSIDTGDLVQISEPEDALVTPMNSPEVPPAQVVEEPVGKLADLFDDLGDDDNTDDFFGEEEEEVQSAAAPVEIREEEPILEEPKQDISEDEPAKEEPIQNEPMKDEPVQIEPLKEEPKKEEPIQIEPMKEEPKKEESIEVETPEEPTVAPPPVQENIDEDDDVFEFDEPENATAI